MNRTVNNDLLRAYFGKKASNGDPGAATKAAVERLVELIEAFFSRHDPDKLDRNQALKDIARIKSHLKNSRIHIGNKKPGERVTSLKNAWGMAHQLIPQVKEEDMVGPLATLLMLLNHIEAMLKG